MPATSTDRIDGLTTSVAVKAPCRAATTANITLSGLQTVGGVVLAAGDRVLVKDQTTTTQNGIYVAATSAWERARDFNGTRDGVNGTRVLVGTTRVYSTVCAAGTVVFGTSPITFTLSGIGEGTNVVSVRDFGAAGDGVTDDAAAIQSAMSSFTSIGGGVYFPAGTYKVGSTLTLKPKVKLWGQHGAVLSWSGGSSAVMFTSSTSIPLEEAGISSLKLDCGNASKCLELFTAFHCTFIDVTIASNSSTNLLIDLLCNTGGTLTPDSTYNSVFNNFDNILQTGTCGTFLRLRGNSAVASQVVTLNTFHAMNALSCMVRGIDFNRWCDSNSFSGMTRVKMDGVGSIGVEQNVDDPTGDNGVYSNNFQHLAIDTFGSIGGRYGLKLNSCKQCHIEYFFQDPEAENGALTATGFTYGFDINQQRPNNNFAYRRMQAVGLMLGGSVNGAYTIYTTSFTLRGTNQASIVVADTYNSEAAGTSCSGITLTPSLQAASWTLGTYYGVNVQNLNKGAGSTATNQVGVYVADLTAGINNFGIQHDVSFGANKYGVYGNGTAINFLRGGLFVAPGTTTATDNFIHISACSGAPAGSPTKYTGTVPLCYDFINNRLYVYSSTAGTTVAAAWRSVLTT